MCNLDGEASGRIFLNIDEVEVEHYLLNNPDVFVGLVNRHQDIVRGQAIQANRQAENVQRNLQQQPNHEPNNANQDDADVFVIPRLHLGLRVNRDGILFTPIQRNSDDEESVDDDHGNDDSDSDDADAFEIPHIGVGMRVDSRTISISLLPETDDEEMDESSDESSDESDSENSDMETDDSDEDQ